MMVLDVLDLWGWCGLNNDGTGCPQSEGQVQASLALLPTVVQPTAGCADGCPAAFPAWLKLSARGRCPWGSPCMISSWSSVLPFIKQLLNWSDNHWLWHRLVFCNRAK